MSRFITIGLESRGVTARARLTVVDTTTVATTNITATTTAAATNDTTDGSGPGFGLVAALLALSLAGLAWRRG